MNLKTVILINLAFQTLATLQLLEGHFIFTIVWMIFSITVLFNLLKKHLDFNKVINFSLVSFIIISLISKAIKIDVVFSNIYLLEFLICINMGIYYNLFKILRRYFYFYLELIIKLLNLVYLLFLAITLLSNFDNFFYPYYYNIDNKIIVIMILTLALQPINIANCLYKISAFIMSNVNVQRRVNVLK